MDVSDGTEPDEFDVYSPKKLKEGSLYIPSEASMA